MAAPPVLAGGVKAIDAWVLPGVAMPMVGAPGAVAAIATFCVTCTAGLKLALPAWLAAIVQVPALTMVTLVPATEHTPGVVEL